MISIMYASDAHTLALPVMMEHRLAASPVTLLPYVPSLQPPAAVHAIQDTMIPVISIAKPVPLHVLLVLQL